MSNPLIVIGGGLAAGTLVAELRKRGDNRPITVVTEEMHPPYERPPLSKDVLLGKSEATDAYVNDEAWYGDHDIELRLGTAATSLDLAGQRVQVGGEWLDYDTLVLATGAAPRQLDLASQADPAYLRTIEDSVGLHKRLKKGTRVGIIGAGWIGLEVASAARQQGCEVVVLEAAALPLERVLGPEVAQVFADLHREHGVDLRLSATLTGITKQGESTVLALADGSSVEVDLLVVGVGVIPRTELAQAAGLHIDNGIRTDSRLRTSDPHVMAIGDVANADHAVLGRPVRVEHWDVAKEHGKVAAANLAGEPTELTKLPYFFTDQYDLGMEYVGNPGPDGFDEVVVRGDVPGRKFVAWWLRDDTVVAGMHANDWDAIDTIRETVGHPLPPED